MLQEDATDIDALKCEIFGKALRRDEYASSFLLGFLGTSGGKHKIFTCLLLRICSWSAADGTDDPLEAAKDSIFVKILLKLIQEGEKRTDVIASNEENRLNLW